MTAENFKDYHNKYVREANQSEDLNKRLTEVNANLEAKAREYKKRVEEIVEEKN